MNSIVLKLSDYLLLEKPRKLDTPRGNGDTLAEPRRDLVAALAAVVPATEVPATEAEAEAGSLPTADLQMVGKLCGEFFLVTILCININYPVVDGRHSFAAPAALNYNQMPSAVVVGGQTHGPVNYLPPSFSYPPQPPVASKVFSGPCYKCKKFGHKAFQCKEP